MVQVKSLKNSILLFFTGKNSRDVFLFKRKQLTRLTTDYKYPCIFRNIHEKKAKNTKTQNNNMCITLSVVLCEDRNHYTDSSHGITGSGEMSAYITTPFAQSINTSLKCISL